MIQHGCVQGRTVLEMPVKAAFGDAEAFGEWLHINRGRPTRHKRAKRSGYPICFAQILRFCTHARLQRQFAIRIRIDGLSISRDSIHTEAYGEKMTVEQIALLVASLGAIGIGLAHSIPVSYTHLTLPTKA